MAELPGTVNPPGMIAAGRAFVSRADAVLPAMAGDEVAPGQPEERDIQPLDGIENVLAAAVRIGESATLLEDPAMEAAAGMFGGIAEEVRVVSTLQALAAVPGA